MKKFILLALLPMTAFADVINGADTAWIMTSTALVLFMTLPGLALFYGGLVRSNNILSVLMNVLLLLELLASYGLLLDTALHSQATTHL